MPRQSTFIEELMAAGGGVIALITGDRKARSYFDMTQRGLVGSFIALLLIRALNAVLPMLLGLPSEGPIALNLLEDALQFVLQLVFSAIALRQLNRMDGLVPYLVADNWATFFLTLVAAAIAAAGLGGQPLIIIFGIVVLIIEVNIARLIIGLSPLQIAMFIVAQLVGLAIAYAIIGFAMGAPPPTDASGAASSVAQLLSA